MAPEAKVTAGQATVTLNDGSTTTYDTEKPIYLYRLSQVYDVGDDTADTAHNIQRGMMIIWTAAGMPYLNGTGGQAAAVKAMEKWLEEDVAAIDRQADAPPTNRAARRQRSRKSPA